MRLESYAIQTTAGPDAVTGYPVWGTRRLMAVDSRTAAGNEWHVTHLPTGRRVAIRSSRAEAENVARLVLRACVRRGWDVEAANPDVIAKAYLALTSEQRVAFRREAGL